ncbi:uncharacterized protein LOC134233447 [Saccostrea cucullata]|uniref:uncharacterized protein LOC134233447 n=1 Tax=Saccostrea cuccullata TaxID=36930 RepID=UPI002ED43C77
MHYLGYFTSFMLLLLVFLHNTSQEPTPVDPKCSDPITEISRCCTDYRTIGKKCYPCMDSFGFECSKSCPEGYHGLKCQDECHCNNTTQYTVGCNTTAETCFNITEEIHNVREEKGPMTWIPILFGLLGSTGSLAVLFLTLYVKERKKLVQKETVLEDPLREENANNEHEQDDYDSIRESRLVLDEDSACSGQKRFKTLDRVSYAKTGSIQNPYNQLSFNRLKSRTMDFRNGELYDISETDSLKMDVGDYVTVASDKADSGLLKSNDSEEDNDEPYNNYYSDVANRQPEKEQYGEKGKQNTDISEKKPKNVSKAQNKKPAIKPKPAHLGIPIKKENNEHKNNRPYSLEKQLD